MNALQSARILRQMTGASETEPLDIRTLLPRYYPVTFIGLAGLRVHAIGEWLNRRQILSPKSLVMCRDRSLRGGIFAENGVACIFYDADDSEDDVRYTLTHEAGHYLQDYLYPREEVVAQLGENVRAILDGLRLPTLEERVNSLLAQTSLYQLTHLMAREDNSPQSSQEVLLREAEADAFACETLASRTAIESQFAWTGEPDSDKARLINLLQSHFRLPRTYAIAYAERLSSQYAPPLNPWRHLRLI